MKTIIILILSCAVAVGATTNDVRVVTTVTSRAETGIAVKLDLFTRGGKTNLSCRTQTRDGAFEMRTQGFYCDGLLVGGFTTYEDHTIIGVGGTPYTLSLECGSNNQMKSASISSNAVILDVFTCTNGVFYPADSAVVRAVHAASLDMRSSR